MGIIFITGGKLMKRDDKRLFRIIIHFFLLTSSVLKTNENIILNYEFGKLVGRVENKYLSLSLKNI